MQTLINLCGKYRKWIYAFLSLILILILCFPISRIYTQEGTHNYIELPFFAALPVCLSYISQMSELLPPYQNLVILDIISFCAFVVFVILLITFWIFTIKNRKFPFFITFIPVLAIYILQGFFYFISSETERLPNGDLHTTTLWHLNFTLSPLAIILIVLICLYVFAVLFGKLYPRMRPKVAETVTKVADKIKSHKSKSQRIEELERQNAEIQRQLDELKRKD